MGVLPFNARLYTYYPVRNEISPPVPSRTMGQPKSLCANNIPWQWEDFMTVEEQISTFKFADVIVSPHGAGLGNLVYCDPGTRLLEIFSGLNKTQCFGLCTRLKIDYRFLSGINGNRLKNKNKKDIMVDPVDFERQLELICG